MNQAQYLSHVAAIKAGETAEGHLVNRFNAILKAANIYLKSRQADWDKAYPVSHGIRWGTPQSIFTMDAEYESHDVSNEVIELTHMSEDRDGDHTFYHASFPESLVWATDAELATYLAVEFDRIVAKKAAEDKAKEDAKAANELAEFERLRVKYPDLSKS